MGIWINDKSVMVERPISVLQIYFNCLGCMDIKAPPQVANNVFAICLCSTHHLFRTTASCLGPLLFIYYINDLIEPTSKDNMILFADDVVIYEGKENAKELETSLQGRLNVVVRWCTNNNMKMNVSKTKLMTFNTRTNDHCDLYIPDDCIGRTNSC